VPEILRRFTNRLRADWVLLADSSGVPLAYSKSLTVTLPPAADLAMIAKVSVAQLALMREINRAIGAGGPFSSIFEEGEQRNVFICSINQDFILTALVDKTAMARLVHIWASETAANLREVLEKI
jgi:predicted regulator of Ras-like GTPase activity (Roadblock/LC7/MglB family)